MTTIFQRVTLSYYKKNKHALHFHRLRGYHLASHSPKAARHAILTKATKRISSGCSGGKASSKPDDKQAQQEEQQEEKKQQGNSSKAGTAKGHDAAKEYGPGKKKARTENVWLYSDPINNFIYRWVIFFAPNSQKDWASGHRFIEYVLAHEKLEEDERWVMEGLMAIRGSRNGVFYADAIAIALWLERGVEYLERLEELAVARGDRIGGATRRQLLEMARDPVVKAALHSMALMYLELYLPFMSAVTHVEDVAEELPVIDQAFYKALEDADVTALLEGGDGDGEALVPPQYDRVQQSTRDKRAVILSRIRGLDSDVCELTKSMLTAMLQAGAGMLHRHTIERQAEQHNPTTPDAGWAVQRRQQSQPRRSCVWRQLSTTTQSEAMLSIAWCEQRRRGCSIEVPLGVCATT